MTFLFLSPFYLVFLVFIFCGGPIKLASHAADDEACHNVCNMSDAANKKNGINFQTYH